MKNIDLIQLWEQIGNFMDMLDSNLEPYQTSLSRTSKFHMLNRIIQDMKDMGRTAYI